MTRWMQLQWIAALTLAIALAPDAASALEDDTITINGSFRVDYMYGELDLYYFDYRLHSIYVNGNEHTWTLTLHGTTQTHRRDGTNYGTEIHATSFELEFFGPDGAALNGIVSDHLAGEGVYVYLQNTYYDDGSGLAKMYVGVGGGNGELYFSTGHNLGVNTLFPTDADGYPIVQPEPLSIETDFTELGYFEMFSGSGGAIGSLGGSVTFEGRVGQPAPEQPVVLTIADASVLEGNNGTSTLTVAVKLSRKSSTKVTVNYATANGTALAKSDYSATSGTLTFQPGQTSRTISVSVTADRKREVNEVFSVQLSKAVGATIADGVATVTIVNDD